MEISKHPGSNDRAAVSAFVTTRWSVVLRAGASHDATQAHAALAQLCQAYWYPLYAYVRRRGHNAHDAQDLTQGFFCQLLERQSLSVADPQRGRFRSFLLSSMNHYLAGEWKRENAQKRGGGERPFSLDWAAAEQRFDLEPADHAAPDALFEKQWATTLLAEVLHKLESEYHAAGKAGLFASLKHALMAQHDSEPYADLAQSLGMNEGALKVAIHRLRKRYRELIREEISNTVDRPREVDEEMRHLYKILAG